MDASETLDPIALFKEWFKEAEVCEPLEPEAMALATVDAKGMPNVRMVLMKAVDEKGFIFYTNTESVKGRELDANSTAALCFFWKSLRRQVRVRGVVESVSAQEADAYFASRPRGSRIGAWASKQSQPLESRAELEEALDAVEQKYPTDDVPRPPHWSGFRICPLEIEYMQLRPFRLHERLKFSRADLASPWEQTLLYP